MDEKSAKRLRYIGLGVVLISLLLLWLPIIASEKVKYDDAIASTLAIGIGLLLISEVGPWIKTLKAGGMQVEFVHSASEHLNELEGRLNKIEARIAQLELTGATPSAPRTERAAAAEAAAAAAAAGPPGLKQDPKHPKDRHKGRFGGKAQKDGYRLSAGFRPVAADRVEILLRVDAPTNAQLPEGAVAEFYLHQTFRPDVVPALFENGVAELKLIAWGGFTVGAWIPFAGVDLEFDLAEARGAPRIIREL